MSVDLPPKYCPDCAVEYRHEAERCADCGSALVLEPPSEQDAAELPPAEEMACLLQGDPRVLHHWAAVLAEAGFASRIDSYPPGRPLSADGQELIGFEVRLGLYVEREVHQDAQRALQDYERRRMPDAPDEVADVGTELDACPACGDPLAATATECGSCGLEFPAAE